MSDGLIAAIAETLRCDPSSLTETSGLGRHPRWDSLGHISVVAMLEHVYQIEITEENVMLLTTVAEIRVYLGKKGLPR